MATFSFNTKWGRIYADEHTTVEQMMQHGVPEETARALLNTAHAGLKHLVKATPTQSQEADKNRDALPSTCAYWAPIAPGGIAAPCKCGKRCDRHAGGTE